MQTPSGCAESTETRKGAGNARSRISFTEKRTMLEERLQHPLPIDAVGRWVSRVGDCMGREGDITSFPSTCFCICRRCSVCRLCRMDLSRYSLFLTAVSKRNHLSQPPVRRALNHVHGVDHRGYWLNYRKVNRCG